MSPGHLERLRRVRDLLAVKGHDTEQTRLTCYSGARFGPELADRAACDPLIRMVDLEELYASRHREVPSAIGESSVTGGLPFSEVARRQGLTHCDLRVAVT
jgi:hypothetical protein